MRSGLLLAGAIGLALLGTAMVAMHGRHEDRTATPPRLPDRESREPDGRLRRADAANGARLFGRCAACHSIGSGGADLDGPNLYGVVGSKVAERRTRFAYSAALRRTGGVWTVARLDAWLTNPAAFAPGTTMTFGGLPDEGDRADLVAYLAAQGSKPPPP